VSPFVNGGVYQYGSIQLSECFTPTTNMKKTTTIILAGLTLALCGCSSTDGPLLTRDSDTDANGNAVSTKDQTHSMNHNFVSGTGGSATTSGSGMSASAAADAGGGQNGSMTMGGGYH
jgi:hypothetical protein